MGEVRDRVAPEGHRGRGCRPRAPAPMAGRLPSRDPLTRSSAATTPAGLKPEGTGGTSGAPLGTRTTIGAASAPDVCPGATARPPRRPPALRSPGSRSRRYPPRASGCGTRRVPLAGPGAGGAPTIPRCPGQPWPPSTSPVAGGPELELRGGDMRPRAPPSPPPAYKRRTGRSRAAYAAIARRPAADGADGRGEEEGAAVQARAAVIE